MANPPGIRFIESDIQIAVAPAGASLTAFAGQATRGRIDTAQLVSGWADFVELYGGFSATSDSYDLALAMWDYLRNGGNEARILRIVGDAAVQADSTVLGSRILDYAAAQPFRVYAADPGAWGNSLSISVFRKAVKATEDATQSTDTVAGVALPTAGGGSQDMVQVALTSVRDVQVGDVYTPYDGTTGDQLGASAITVLEVDSVNSSIRYITPNVAVSSSADLKSASRHLGSTRITAQVAEDATSAIVSSTDGFQRGSLVSLILSSVYDNANLAASSRAVHVDATIDRIVGNVVHFANVGGVQLPNGTALPAAVVAKDLIDGNTAGTFNTAGACTILLDAKTAGATGNSITVNFVSTAATRTVSVSGQIITVNFVIGDTATEIVATIVASAAAAALVTAAVGVGGAQATVGPAAGNTVSRALSGGADLKMVSQEFDLAITEDGAEVEFRAHEGLSLTATSPNYIGTRLGGELSATFGFQIPSDTSSSVRIVVGNITEAGTVATLPIAMQDLSLSGGLNGSVPTDNQVIGTESPRTGFYILDGNDDVDLVASPGFTSAFVQRGLAAYAEGRGSLLALLDMPSDLTTSEAMGSYRSQTLASETSYAALYAPYGKILDPRRNKPRGSLVLVPPSPAVAGLMAARAASAGPHVPAANQQLSWAGVEFNVSEAEHGALNELGINIIKLVKRTGIRLYGARTLSNAADGRKFTNVRRWLNYAKQSLGESLVPYIFKPANATLFADIGTAVRRFLESEWQAGALYPQDRRNSAYFVKCDSETSSALDLSNGIVNCVIAVSPVTPAEQIVFKINVSAGGIRVDEQ